jgi:hypothetical protein
MMEENRKNGVHLVHNLMGIQERDLHAPSTKDLE